MNIKVNALCTATCDYNDNTVILTLCTQERGKLTAGIRGSKKPTSKLRFASSFLCFGEYILSEKGGRFTVTNCTAIDNFYDIRTDVEKFYCASAVAELLDKTSDEEYSNIIPALKAVKDIAYNETHTPLYYLFKYMTDTVLSMGYALNMSACACGGEPVAEYIDYEKGGAVCVHCYNNYSVRIKPETFKALRIGECPFGNYTEPIKVLAEYLSYHTNIRINSVRQLLYVL